MNAQQTLADQYRTPNNLEARISLHERFSTNKYGWQRWAFDQFELPHSARVLELGCGIGTLWLENIDRFPADWDVTLCDFSKGMLDGARQNLAGTGFKFTCQVADANEIPFAAEQFDAVIANHILYYVEDKPRAYAGIRRVLKPGGRLYAATNGKKHMQELVALVRTFDPSIPFAGGTIESFTLETGAQEIAEWFSDVELRRYPDGLVVTDEEALIDYVFSTSSVTNLPDQRKAELARFISERFSTAGGVFEITKDAGIICGRRT